MSVLEAHREGILLTAERKFSLRNTVHRDHLSRLGLFVYRGTGANTSQKRYWDSFWREHGKDDPRSWLLRWLRWDVEPDELTARAVIERWRDDPKGHNHEHHYHSLARLLVAKDADRPVQADLATWQKLLR